MNNTNQQLYSIYQNIQSFYEYRRLIPLDNMMSQAEFVIKIQRDTCILLSAIDKTLEPNKEEISNYVNNYNEKGKDKNVDVKIFQILLIYPGTECETKSANMLKYVNRIRYPVVDVLIITQNKLSTSVLKSLSSARNNPEHNNHTFNAYTYDLLITVIPEFELAPSYEILSEVESRDFDRELLPKISEHDPQVVWIGAKVGDILKYTTYSEITIYKIGYCTVIGGKLK